MSLKVRPWCDSDARGAASGADWLASRFRQLARSAGSTVADVDVPPPQVCPLCAHDDEVSAVPDGEKSGWRFVCENHEMPYTWLVKAPRTSSGREGISAEIGLYDDLVECVHGDDPWLEHGIVEYRYQLLRPTLYRDELVARFGHRAQGPRHFSTSALIAKALGQLRDEGILSWRYGKATGFWAYNGSISYWAAVPPPAEGSELTWVHFAHDVGLDPEVWVLS